MPIGKVKFVKVEGSNPPTWTVHPDSVDELETQMNDVLRNAFGITLDELREQVKGDANDAS